MRSYTDSISPPLAAEGALHEYALIRSFTSLIVSMVATCFWKYIYTYRPCAHQILDTEVDTRVLLHG